jgi:hypothetical protein
MHQRRIELVEIRTDLMEPGLERQHPLIGLEEGTPERPEHRGESELDFSVSAIDGRVYEAGDPVAVDEEISRP